VAGGESSRGFSSERACSILAVDHKRLVARRAIERKAEWIIPEQSRTYDPGGCTTGLFDHRSIIGLQRAPARRYSRAMKMKTPRVKSPVTDFQIIYSWCADLKTIGRDLRSLNLSRRVFWEIQGIIEANPKVQTHGLFNRWMETNYAVAAAIGIRRQLDLDRRSISLATLLSAINETICERPDILSRAGFIGNYRPELRPAAEAQFDRLVGEGVDRVDCGLVCRDLRRLREEPEPVKGFANKRAAHWDRRSQGKSKLGELDVALDLLVELVNKYALILHGGSGGVEVNLLPDWKQVFRVPWIPPKKRAQNKSRGL
jgi:hypothetical protein